MCDSACVVFVPDHPGIDNTPQIERFQEKAYMELQDYVTRTYPEDSYRSVGFTSVLHSAILLTERIALYLARQICDDIIDVLATVHMFKFYVPFPLHCS